MEVKKGYKLTEVGVIPEDWEVKTIGEACQIFGRIGFRGYTVKDIVAEGKGAITISPSNIKNNKMDFSNCTYITWFKYEESPEIKIYNGDVLLVKTGSTFGKTAIVQNLSSKATINPQLVVLKKIKIDNYFLGYMMGFEVIQNQITSSIVGGAIPTLSQQLVSNFKFPLPTKAEQTAIADALSDADALIQSLEKLIAKKRLIKQGAMQELLKPKEGWVERSLLELADGRKELFDDGDWIETEHIIDEGIRIIQTGNIGQGTFLDKESKKYISQESFKKLKCKEVIEGDLLICRLAEPAGRACVMPNIGEQKMVTAVDITIFRPLQNLVNKTYLVNLFSTADWFYSISEKCGGTTRTRIARGALGKIKLLLPPIDEQTHIAIILSDMDAEISALETKIVKYRQIKQGMMQELLTGRIRLV